MRWDTGPGAQSSPLASVETKTEPNGTVNGHTAVPGSQVERSRPGGSLLLSSTTTPHAFAREDPRVIAALEEYLEAIRAGHPWSRDEFLAQHLEIAEALGECLSGLEFIQGAAGQLAGSRPASAAQLADVIPADAQLGEYRIVREVGRGGMGVVYEAEQVTLGRRVALKVLPFAAAIDPKQRQRFQIEAQAAAQLHHPHIVPIFGVGCDHGIHYYAMQFVEGRSLAAILHESRSSHETRAAMGAQSSSTSGEQPANGPMHLDRAYCLNVARLGAEAADALEHAHGLGIVHRDIKPANLLIDPDNELWITDFGLARCTTDLSLTHTGDMVGTLRYMSPEQAQARGGVVDQRTDIYALGVTLYELLTLQPALTGRDHQELLRQIAQDEPVAPRRLNAAVPPDLETIVLKAIAKDPASRYTTAQEVADDLRRFMEDRPILARRPGLLERTIRWARRHRDLVVTAAAILLLALFIGSAATWMQARKLEAGNRKHEAFIIDSYPLLDRSAKEAVMAAFQSPTVPSSNTGASQNLEQAISIFEQASELPPIDAKSRSVIARAHTRLGYTRWIMSLMKSTAAGPDRRLLAQAQDDYRRSIGLLEKELAASPDDPRLRRYMAEAIGFQGMGCCMLSAGRSDESASLYRRSIEIRRKLLCLSGSGGAAGAQSPSDVAGELEDLSKQVQTVHILAEILESKGKKADANGLRRQLEDDVVLLAARLSSPEFQPQRSSLAQKLVEQAALGPLETSGANENSRRDSMTTLRLAVIVDPENAQATNNLAWSLIGTPSSPWFDPERGLALARKAVELEPNAWAFLNTLGVAEYRARNWENATRVLQKSITFTRVATGGVAHDLFFLAMSFWQQGRKDEARELYARAVAWTEKNNPNDAELRQFRAEAAALFGEACAKPHAEKATSGDQGDSCRNQEDIELFPGKS